MKSFATAFRRFFSLFFSELFAFISFFSFYIKQKILTWSIFFEKNKNILVHFLLMKRGRYNRPFMHVATIAILGAGVVTAPFLSETYPIFSSNTSNLSLASSMQQSIAVDQDVFQTQISQKPRDTIITYTVQPGDTLSTIAKKFSQPNNTISTNTIRWANNLTSDTLNVGDTLKILPVTGIAHKVESGDTIYSIAKKYNTDPQKIVDFPFNDFANPETFSLVVGEILIVPDGIQPSEQNIIKPQVYIAQGPVAVISGGFTWPVHGLITQFASWYHMALDIAAPYGTPIVAAQSGTVTEVRIGSYDTGYGNNVWISNGAGMETHYAHMEAANVSVGQQVTGGSTVIGWIGLTGRTTGPHVHFEIRKNGVLVDPLPYLQ